MLTFVGLGAGTHSVIHLQLTLQRVDELPALAELLLQQRDLVLEPEDIDTLQHGKLKRQGFHLSAPCVNTATCWFSPGWPGAPVSGCVSAAPAPDCEPAGV